MISCYGAYFYNQSHNDCSGVTCGGSGNDDGWGLLCVCMTLATVGFCICTGVNLHDTAKSREAPYVKYAKFGLYLISFLIPAALTYSFISPRFEKNITDDDPKMLAYFCIDFLLPTFMGAIVVALSTYIGKQFECDVQEPVDKNAIAIPRKEILDELATIKQLLENNYVNQRRGDDPEQCKEFIKEVVRYYIRKNCRKTEVLVDVNESLPLLAPASVAHLVLQPLNQWCRRHHQ